MTSETCSRCGSEFLVALCVVARPPDDTHPRDRIEGYLCYSCRQDEPNERLT